MSIQYTDAVDLLTGLLPENSTGVTVDTTGSGYDISLRSQIVIQFLATSITSGNGVFTVDGSNDGSHWTTGLAFQDLTATASTTYVTSKTLSSNTSAGAKLPAGWRFIRAKVDLTTDGTYFAFMEAAG